MKQYVPLSRPIKNNTYGRYHINYKDKDAKILDKLGSSKIAHTRFKPKDFVNTAKNAHYLDKAVYVSTSKLGEILFKKLLLLRVGHIENIQVQISRVLSVIHQVFDADLSNCRVGALRPHDHGV